jgi:hypothetical protein
MENEQKPDLSNKQANKWRVAGWVGFFAAFSTQHFLPRVSIWCDALTAMTVGGCALLLTVFCLGAAPLRNNRKP